jgi:hypothetical protein
MTWLTAVAKLAPYVADIAVAAIPRFTQRKIDPAAIEEKPLQQQFDELQAASIRNAEHIRQLATELQAAMTALEEGGEAIEARFRRVEILTYVALAVSVVSALLLLAILLR